MTRRRYTRQVAIILVLTTKFGSPFCPRTRHYLIPKYTNVGVVSGESPASTDAVNDSEDNNGGPLKFDNNDDRTDDESMDSSMTYDGDDDGSDGSSSSLALTDRKMNLMMCGRDNCKDVVRERVVGDHNQIVLNGPATGQVAYRWSRAPTPTPSGDRSPVSLSSVLLLVKPNDEELMKKAAEAVPMLTEAGLIVLLAPDLAAKLKYYYGVDDERIALFEAPRTTHTTRRVWHSDDDEEDWVKDMYLEPFPDLVCTLGGDGLLLHASMLFQGPAPPIISIAGGSLGFLTPFSLDEMVDAIRIALGMAKGEIPSAGSSNKNSELEVFPPNMPSYPYEPLIKPPPYHKNGPKLSFGLGDIICMTIRMRLDCRVINPEGVVRARFNVLNEVVIDRGSSPYLAALECFCDDVHLTTVQADGVIFAT
jgi:NAD kinase